MKIIKILAVTILLFFLAVLAIFYEGDIPKDVIDARYSNHASQFLDLGDRGRIHFRDQGNLQGTPLVLLHGSNASLHTFEPWVAHLQDSYRVITLDLPAHGLTGATASGIYNYTSYADVVLELTEHLNVDRFVLGGNSMGGNTAWRFAVKHPERLLGLVLMNVSAPNVRVENNRERPLAFTLLGQAWFRSIAQKFDPYFLVEQGLRSAYNQSPVVTDELIMRYYDLNLRAGTRAATISRFGQRSKDDYELTDITTPTLIMWGLEDSVTPFSYASHFETALPDAQTAYYEDVGHIPMEEVPEQSANDVSRFISQL